MFSPTLYNALKYLQHFYRVRPAYAILATLLLANCGGGSGNPPPLTLSSSVVPNGTVGVAYGAAFGATGGVLPYTWSITAGSLPSGLSLNSLSGVISGTPSTTADNTPLTIQVQDSGNPQQTASVNVLLDIIPIPSPGLPSYLGLTTTQEIVISATTNDPKGVTWNINPNGGSFSPATSLSGENVTFEAPATAGVYTITAINVTDGSTAASATVGVTDLEGVYTYHNDLSRDGANDQEYLLTPAVVSSGDFGKIFSCTVDGAIYAQPLWVANMAIGGATHNVVFVATEHDSVYAFDADQSPCLTLWSADLIDSTHGATDGETTVVSGGPGHVVGNGVGTISPETGVTGTPVIDPVTGTLYVVSKSMDSSATIFYQRLHAIDLITGLEKSGSPVTVTATYPGTGDGGASVVFDPKQELQRPGLALVNGTVVITWGSHEDTPPYYGWVIGYTYNGSSFTQTSVLNVTPNVGYGGIWMGGGAPAGDSNGNLYLLTGNGVFDANASAPLPNNDYGDSLLQLSSNLTVSQYFTPSDQALGVSQDLDFGSGGAAVLVDLPPTSPRTHLLVGGGKDAYLRIFNRDALGGYGDQNVWQQISIIGPVGSGSIYSTPAFWNNYLYIQGLSAALLSFQLDPATAKFSLASTATLISGDLGSSSPTPSISASQGSNGIVWIINSSQHCTVNSAGIYSSNCGPAILDAYDATNLANQLWSSSFSATDTAGNAVSFTVPTIANGKVYVGTRGNNVGGPYESTTISGELDVYGLK